ncbi:hypothetical protein PTSG_05640 [Salpingoeca rosetta]|uniref:Uncharacterized protein n=1 Tax=Salpingoeca rosetta (strain ATCC 50818 / BSB-021) TaxID=946362 RepID=F2UBT0_SALR5|nr:uncharacterized protein PTSG_05640 [Salpingoeca rosetta]EGD73946.1 hypothetical protein PTSG_05640 [Salpingoeca rosetta]|eukprot:XP_004993509.1 hypothetical protein PTSG_05640 [Salpingoeca rosetta]
MQCLVCLKVTEKPEGVRARDGLSNGPLPTVRRSRLLCNTCRKDNKEMRDALAAIVQNCPKPSYIDKDIEQVIFSAYLNEREINQHIARIAREYGGAPAVQSQAGVCNRLQVCGETVELTPYIIPQDKQQAFQQHVKAEVAELLTRHHRFVMAQDTTTGGGHSDAAFRKRAIEYHEYSNYRTLSPDKILMQWLF